jgi:hypothetical protein
MEKNIEMDFKLKVNFLEIKIKTYRGYVFSFWRLTQSSQKRVTRKCHCENFQTQILQDLGAECQMIQVNFKLKPASEDRNHSHPWCF